MITSILGFMARAIFSRLIVNLIIGATALTIGMNLSRSNIQKLDKTDVDKNMVERLLDPRTAYTALIENLKSVDTIVRNSTANNF